jgi:hypothetical protein
MVVLWIILIEAFANQAHQEVPVYAFVVMERHKIEIVETQERADN